MFIALFIPHCFGKWYLNVLENENDGDVLLSNI